MGQGQSITTFDYDHVNQLIKNSPQYISEQWQSSGTAGKTNYWQTINRNLKATIDHNEWPLTASRMKFTPGHHFFSVSSNGDKFYYDLENDNWVDLTPPELFDTFMDKWTELIKSAESQANSTPEQRTQALEDAKVDVKNRRAGTTVTRTVTQTTNQSGGGHHGHSHLTDEDLTQITILFEQILQPLEDRINRLQDQVDQLSGQNQRKQMTRRTVNRQPNLF